ncbi:MAG: hypothetical protein KF773_10550 [Deltaproteobacteria bacterium]|nr:hypothetical protein [Deltaproteobacteria bacterium]
MPEQLLAMANALLEAVEGLPANARGALVVSQENNRRGMVLVEGNRVCWAMAIGLEARLRQLMKEQADQVAALRQHSIESLVALCGAAPPESISWTPRVESLAPVATFAPTELLAAVGASFYAAEAEAATHGSVHAAGATGASFAIGDTDEPVVVREVAGDRLGVATLLALGEWAAAALGATTGFTDAMIDQTLTRDRTHASVAVGWRTGRRVVHAVIIEDHATLENAVQALRRRHVPIVVSVRVPWKLKTAHL